MTRFDPFDPNNRDKRKRRTKAQIEADTKSWNMNLDDAFKIVLNDMRWPDYVQANTLLEDAAQHHPSYYALKSNMKKCMGRIGYVKMINPDTTDGRWKAYSKGFFVYKKEHLEDIDRDELSIELEW